LIEELGQIGRALKILGVERARVPELLAGSGKAAP
jgi:hypothetical protein